MTSIKDVAELVDFNTESIDTLTQTVSQISLYVVRMKKQLTALQETVEELSKD